MIAKSLNTKTNKSNPPKCANPGKSSGRKASRKNVNKLLKSLR